jgi:hypothetical protein
LFVEFSPTKVQKNFQLVSRHPLLMCKCHNPNRYATLRTCEKIAAQTFAKISADLACDFARL